MADAVVCIPSAPTIRISNIPIQISRDDLQKYLQELDSLGTIAVNTAGHLYISLAPEASEGGHPRFQVATVTFSHLIYVRNVELGPPGATFEAMVDTHFRGLTPLNNPKDPTIDIIAVTGLAGHAFGSWRSREGYGMWLRDFLPTDMEDNSYRARIFTYGYDTTLVGSASHAGIDHFSQRFIEAVKVARSECSSRPLILIGHSLGGLVIKDAIVQCFQGMDGTLRSVTGILFFSVPHKGLADASLLSMVHGQPNENLVRDLCGNTQFLRGLDRSFGYHMNLGGMSTNIISFYETDETPTVKELGPGKWGRGGPCVRMVTQESIKHAAGSGQDFPMDANHSSIVKFVDRSDQKYQLVFGKLLGIACTISITQSETRVPCEDRIKVCEWLYSGVVDRKHKEISGKRQESTGGWLLADDKFTSWIGGSGPRILWGCGIPGAGKTFLSSLVIDVLEARSGAYSSTGLAYFYFDYNDHKEQTPIMLLRSLIRQIVASPRALGFPIPEPVKSLYGKHRAPGTTPELNDLQTALEASLAPFTEIFFVFDALDECREDIGQDLLTLFHWIAGKGGRIFLTSRPHVAVSLNPTTDSDVERLDLEAKGEDVTVYIERTIQRHTRARNLITGDLRARVVSKLVEACKGMFLLVHFYIDGLCQHRTVKEIRRALDSISPALGAGAALDETYVRIMNTVRAQSPSCAELALKVLTWLLTASGTLSVDKLRMAVAMGDGSRLGDPGPFDELEEMADESSLVEVCCGLVMIDHSDPKYFVDHSSGTIKLVHYSAREYLEKTCALGSLANRHLTVALGLLDYVWLSYIEPDLGRDCLLKHGGLMSYVLWYLRTHMRACHHIAPTETLLKFLWNNNLVRYIGEPFSGPYCERSYGPLHEATAWGSTILANRLLNDGADPHDAGTYTPLHVAARENLGELVSFWLENGVGVNATDGDKGTPLSYAIAYGSIDAARVLLSSGADVVTALRMPNGNRVLRYPDMLELLFHFGLSVEHRLENETLLVHAIRDGYSAAVESLLQKGARIHVRNQMGETPLHEAVRWEKADVARLLLQRGYGGHEDEEGEDAGMGAGGGGGGVERGCSCCGDHGHRTPAGRLVDARDCRGKTPLHLAAEFPSEHMLRLLLSHGIEGCSSDHVRAPRVHEHAAAINAQDESGCTALYYATAKEFKGGTPLCYVGAGRYSAAKVHMLLDAGADLAVPPTTRSTYTWLHVAATECDVSLLKAALDAGVDPHARDGKNNSPLHFAVSRASVEVVSLLLERDLGLPVDLRDRNGRTPLHHACGAATIILLLEQGACISSVDASGNSPLHSRLGRFENHTAGGALKEEVRLLLDAGADVNARNKSDTTPLHLAAEVEGQGLVDLLLESGAELGALDVNQMSAMHHAAGGPGTDAISVLAEMGLSIEARDNTKKTPLHHAALGYWKEENVTLLVRLLVEKGASVDARDSGGFTPLGLLVKERWDGGTRGAVGALVQAGADVNTVHNDGVSLLHLAAQKGNNELLHMLVDAGADIHARDSNQRTPLHYAVLPGHQWSPDREDEDRNCRFLADRGANVNARDTKGNTPLQYLLGKSWATGQVTKVAKQLLSVGASLNTINNKGQSPLHQAAKLGSKELVDLLLSAGADIHARDSNQRTPLHYAVLPGAAWASDGVSVAGVVVRSAGPLQIGGADVNARDIDGNTPLQYLLGMGYASSWVMGVAKELLSVKASVNTINNNGQSPLHQATQAGNEELVGLLLNAGADIHACDSKERTQLDASINCGLSNDITQMLVDRSSGQPPVVEMDEAPRCGESPGQHSEEEPARKRRYSMAFPPQ